MLDPGTGLIIFIVGGIGTVVSFSAFKIAQQVGPGINPSDLLPAPPWVGLPIPLAFYTKPELLESFRRQ